MTVISQPEEHNVAMPEVPDVLAIRIEALTLWAQEPLALTFCAPASLKAFAEPKPTSSWAVEVTSVNLNKVEVGTGLRTLRASGLPERASPRTSSACRPPLGLHKQMIQFSCLSPPEPEKRATP